MITRGRVTKIVRSYGSTWGRITPDGESRQVFFNSESLFDAAEYSDLTLDQEVVYEEEPDRANGTRAVRVRIRATEAIGH